MANNDNDRLLANWKCLLACLLVSMSPFQYGIDFGLIAGLQAMVGFLKVYGYAAPELASGWNISTERQQLISSLMTLGAVITSCFAGPIAWKLGRKICLWTACVLCAGSNVVMMATTSISGLYAGRLLIGVANGLFMSFSQLYLQECAPARYRGLALAGFNFWTSIGTLVGTIVDNYTSPIQSKASYLIPLGLIYIVPFFIFFGLFFIPESPRWLMERGQTEKARKALLWLRPDTDAVETELQSIQTGIDEAQQHQGKQLWLEMWRNPVDRRRSILAICAVNTQAASGAMYMISYGTYFFEMAGVGNAFRNSVVLVGVGVIVMIINIIVITRWGRRRVMLSSGLLLCGVVQLIIAAIYDARPQNQSVMKAIVGLSVVYIIGYNGMISSYSWVSGGELPSQRLRSYTFGMAAAVGFLGAWLTTFTAPYFINPASLNWGPKYGYIWAPVCFLTAAWVFVYLPEVKGRTLEEIDEMFAAGLPARKFRKYVCTGPPESTEMQSKAEGVETIERISVDRKEAPNVSEAIVNPF